MAGWIGFDLDATLARYDGWKGPNHIGEPILPMVEIVQRHLQAGQRVKIFTARACIPEQIPPVKLWLANIGFGGLDVTCTKDFEMLRLFDDRVVPVVPNQGRPYWLYDPVELTMIRTNVLPELR